MTDSARRHTWPRRLYRTAIYAVLAAALIVATVVVGAAVDARSRLPDLQPWHRFVPPDEASAANLTPQTTLPEYLAREQRVFDAVQREIEDALPASPTPMANRYARGSRSSPTRFAQNYNRTFQVEPREMRGGALLVHGLTDGPYSMRAIADHLAGEGYYSLALRLPGHDGVAVRVPARAEATVSLDDPSVKGIHMSRLFLRLQEVFDTRDFTPGAVDDALSGFLASHREMSRSAHLAVEFDHLIRRAAVERRHRLRRRQVAAIGGILQPEHHAGLRSKCQQRASGGREQGRILAHGVRSRLRMGVGLGICGHVERVWRPSGGMVQGMISA